MKFWLEQEYRFARASSAAHSSSVRGSLLLCGLLTVSCGSFGADNAASEQNSCVVDSDCTSKHCEAGRCVMPPHSADSLSVMLEVTPKRMPDSSQPFPIVTDPFALQGSGPKLTLRMPIPVPIEVTGLDGEPVDAQVSFRPKLGAGSVAKATQVSTVQSTATSGPPSVTATLLKDLDYDVLVQPVDSKSLPPYSMQFTAAEGSSLQVDYNSVQWVKRKFLVRNVPSGTYALRARAKNGGPIISNAQLVESDDVTLWFPPDDTPYELELSATGKASTSTNYSGCLGSGALMPTFTVDPDSLQESAKASDILAIDLPAVPDPLNYSGVINLCDNQRGAGNIPLTLRTTEVSLPTSSQGVQASFEISTMATPVTADEAAPDKSPAPSNQFNYCARVLPGDYVVIATPLAGTPCEIFAEHRKLLPDTEGLDHAELDMRTPATLSGTILTPDAMPMANASIDFVALNFMPGIMLAEDDPTVPIYNRSKQGTSAADGTFKVPIDVGSYDVIVKPPAQSDFAWKVYYGIDIASRTPPFTTKVSLTAPTVISGTLRYESGSSSDNRTLAGADVHAYTVVDEDTKRARSVEIARGQADQDGKITLLVSSSLQDSL